MSHEYHSYAHTPTHTIQFPIRDRSSCRHHHPPPIRPETLLTFSPHNIKKRQATSEALHTIQHPNMTCFSRLALLTAIFQALSTTSPVAAKLRGTEEQQERKLRKTRSSPLPLPESLKEYNRNNAVKVVAERVVNGRIVGGDQVSGPGAYPFFVSWGGECGASLIHPDIVLSAAHCDGINSNSVIVNAYELDNPNTSGAVVANIADKSLHPQYNDNTLAYDYMLIKLSSPVTSVTPIPVNFDQAVPAVGESLTVICLGVTQENGNQPDFLRQVSVDTFSDSDCSSLLNGAIQEDIMLCAASAKDRRTHARTTRAVPFSPSTPQADTTNRLESCRGGYGCARPNSPGVYAETSGVQSWMEDEICRLSSVKPSSCGGTPPLAFSHPGAYPGAYSSANACCPAPTPSAHSEPSPSSP